MIPRLICCLILMAVGVIVDPLSVDAVEANKVRIILVGDSTMATRTGYGDALCERFQANVECINAARGGRSSGSFRAEGLWDKVMEVLRDNGDYQSTYVLIQFGHNDQPGKPGRSTNLAAEFPANLARYVDEARSANANVVLVTPLTRRSFRDGALQNDLKPWADAVKLVAEQKKVALLPLNDDSFAAVAAMGSTEADTLAQAPPSNKNALPPLEPAKAEPNGIKPPSFDYTHLGAKGSAYFSNMVAREIAQAVPALSTYLRTDAPAK